MPKKKSQEFEKIISDIVANQEFQKLNSEIHHGITRYKHSLRVAKATYKTTKTLKMDYIKATRAALLHDFFLNDQFEDGKTKKKFASHPSVAVENAKRFYDISAKEENIIASHMFPANKTLPKSKEAWTVSIMDKSVALYEVYRFKLAATISLWAIFLFNLLTIQK